MWKELDPPPRGVCAGRCIYLGVSEMCAGYSEPESVAKGAQNRLYCK